MSQTEGRPSLTIVASEPSGHTLGTLAEQIRSTHAEAISNARTAIGHARRCGELLSAAKEQIPHGHWLPWLAEHTEISPQTAQRWMRLAKADPEQIGEHGIARALGAISNTSSVTQSDETPEPTDGVLVDDAPDKKAKRHITIDGVKFPPGGITEPRDISKYETANLKTLARDLINRATPQETTALHELFSKYAGETEIDIKFLDEEPENADVFFKTLCGYVAEMPPRLSPEFTGAPHELKARWLGDLQYVLTNLRAIERVLKHVEAAT